MAGFDFGFTLPPWGDAVTPPPTPPVVSPGAHARPVIEVGFTTTPTLGGGVYGHWSDPQRGIWDSSLWAPDSLWTDVTAWLQTCSWQRGATRVEGPVLRYESGTATVVLNNSDGRFSPVNLSGPYVSGGRTQVRPMVPVRIGVAYGGDTYWQWRGFADAWNVEHVTVDYSRVTLTATDAQKILARRNRVAGPVVGVGESAGARVNRILNSVGWPATDRVIEAGETFLAGTTLEGDAWAELLLVQDTEVGGVYVDADGKVVFKGLYSILIDAESAASQATFGRHGEPGELAYAAIEPQYDDTTIRNIIRIAREGGVVQEARSDASIAENLEATHERTDLLMQTDSEALDYARYLLALAKDPEYVFAQIAVDPRADDALWTQVLTRDFGDRITARTRYSGEGLVERQVFIRGIAAEYGGTNRWRWTWTLQPAEVFNFGVWDGGAWDTSIWTF